MKARLFEDQSGLHHTEGGPPVLRVGAVQMNKVRGVKISQEVVAKQDAPSLHRIGLDPLGFLQIPSGSSVFANRGNRRVRLDLDAGRLSGNFLLRQNGQLLVGRFFFL